MKLNNIELHDFFREKEIMHLHHANTVTASISFILSGGLLSRGDVEISGLAQTAQGSDEKDKEFDVWDDIFLDTTDLHGFFPRQNIYGPVLFKLDIEFLLKEEMDVWITKDNPMYWHSGLSDEDMYFQSVPEVREKWDSIERQRKMVTIRKPKRPVLFSSLSEIVVDDPRIEIYGDTHVFTEMKNALDAATEGLESLRDKINIRECGYCFCRDNYLHQVPTEHVARLFLPKEHKHFPD